jgi:hypothetical protein
LPDPDTPSAARASAPAPDTQDALAWVREHWIAVAIAALVLIAWLASGDDHNDNGRYVLVKDNVPCEVLRDKDDDGRRWCYVLLDTESGKLEERLRKLRLREKR